MHELLLFLVASSSQVGKAWRVAHALPLKGLMKKQTWKGMLSGKKISLPYLQMRASLTEPSKEHKGDSAVRREHAQITLPNQLFHRNCFFRSL